MTTTYTIATVTTPQGEKFAGRPTDVVAAMRTAGLFTSGKTNREYMTFVARQERRLNGRTIRSTNAATFLADLHRAGIITLRTATARRPS